MSNIRDEISCDVDKKRRVMENLLLVMINSPQVLDFCELSKKKSESINYLNEEEKLAIYSLALEVRKSISAGRNYNARLKDYLWEEDGSINTRNLLKFVNYEVDDIVTTKAIKPKQKWSLSINKIFKAIEEKEGETKKVDLTK